MIIGFDLETTGLEKKYDKIIEIALVKFDENTFEIIDTYSTFVNPEIPIPELISNITNIYDGDVADAPKIHELQNEILDFIGDAPLLGHNVFFDRDFFLQNNIDISKNVVLDTFFLANFLCLYEKSLNLEMLCNAFGVGFSGAHRAINDVHATIKLFEKLLESFKNLDQEKKDLLSYLFSRSEDVNINYLEWLLFGDINTQVTFGFFEEKLLKVIQNKLEIKQDIVDKKQKKKKIKTLFSSLGSVEKRDNQLKMSELVDDTLYYNKKTVIEAPTGLGKSFAYLIPSIQYAVLQNTKVYVSTKTKNLQDQLYDKDLGRLGEQLDINFSYAKLKGKSNYFSTKAFFDDIILGDLGYSKLGFLLKLTLWLYDTKHGELDELNFFGVEYTYLKYINADGFSLNTQKNPYQNQEFLTYARQKAETADIVVINHSLLFSDLHSENSILSKMKNLVIDEAHNIEDSVTESVKQRINELYVGELFDTIEKIFTKLQINKIDFLQKKDQFLSHFNLLVDFSASYLQSKVSGSQNYQVTLLTQEYYQDADLKNLEKKLCLALIDIVDLLAVKNEYDFSKEITILNTLHENIKIFLKNSFDTYIKTISFHEKSGVSLEFTLLNPGNYLQEELWTGLDSVLLTSATLQIGGDFSYFKNILSLEDFGFHLFESDFDYSKQASLFIPNDLGSIKNNSGTVIDFLDKFYKVARGKTLTLLTSFSFIKKIYTQLNQELKSEGIHLLPQGVGGSKSKLLGFYENDASNSILLGTDSFWEGVDIPGEKLKFLVIHKLPFSVPTDPVFLARSVFFEDAFSQYAIPKSIIKLKQGFGRLIRSKNDTGIVLFLDDRIYSTSWGKAFLDAFPSGINKKIVSSDNFLKILEQSMKK